MVESIDTLRSHPCNKLVYPIFSPNLKRGDSQNSNYELPKPHHDRTNKRGGNVYAACEL
ncbi:hypothetical protein [Microcoleus sp.]|uniref:hypothetical protein n=1 Tax=Microcoleus sp. TaxID=44472 RepID=UPI003525BAAD